MTTKAQYDDLATRLAEASKRLRSLQDIKSKADIRLSMLQDELEKLQKQCIELYGTADPEELDRLAAEKFTAAENAVNSFAAQIEQISSRLAEMNTQAAPGA